MQRIHSIQVARALAAFMVVAFHGLRIQEKYLPSSDLLPAFLEIGQTGVDLFFVISGFIMVLVSKDSKAASTADFLAKRFLRIYPTYWVYYGALVLVFLVAPGMINSSDSAGIDLLSSFFLFPSDSLPILLVAWSLTHELWFYLVFAGMLCAPVKLRIYCLALWAALIVCSKHFELSGPFFRVATHNFTIEFILGATSAYAFLHLKNLQTASYLYIWALGTACFLLWFGFAGVLENSVNVIHDIPMSRALLVGGGYALMITSFAMIENSGKLRTHAILKELGDASYSIYLSHILVLSILGRVWLSIMGAEGHTTILEALFWTIAFTCTMIGGYIAYIAIERPLLNLTLRKFRGTSSQLVS